MPLSFQNKITPVTASATPSFSNKVTSVAPAPTPLSSDSIWSNIANTEHNVATGVAKSEVRTVQSLGQLGGSLTDSLGLTKNAGKETFLSDPNALDSQGDAEKTGDFIGTIAPYFTGAGEEAGAATVAKWLPQIAEKLGTSVDSLLPKIAGYAIKKAPSFAANTAVGTSQTKSLLQGAINAVGAEAANSLTPLAFKVASNSIGAVKNLISPDVEVALTKAIKPAVNNTNFTQALSTALPHIAETAEQTGKPITNLDSLQSAITSTKQRIWQNYQQLLGPNANTTIDGNKIADAMVSSIDKRFATQNPSAVQKIINTANTYRRAIPLNEAEDFLQSANNELHSYYAKNKVGQQVAKGDPIIGHVVNEADALREALYSRLSDLTGQDASKIKQTYGALSNIQEAVAKRANVTARQNPDSLAEQISFAQGLGNIGKSALNLNLGDAVGGALQMGASKFIKNRNSTEGLIKGAFNKLAN